MVRFTAADVVRHPLVGKIVEAYEGPGRVMLDIAIDADEEWDSSTAGRALAASPPTAAIAESAFPQLDDSRAPVELSVRLTSDEESARSTPSGAARTSRPTSCPSRWPSRRA
jgi:hypothetical protein